MAILDSTGLDAYLVTSATATATKAACLTAIGAGKKIGQITASIDLGGTRSVSEVKFLSADDSIKSMGSISYPNFTLEMPFDSANLVGQADLKTMFSDKSERKMIIVNTDGTYTTVPVKCSGSVKNYSLDTFVMYKSTVEQNGAATEIIA